MIENLGGNGGRGFVSYTLDNVEPQAARWRRPDQRHRKALDNLIVGNASPNVLDGASGSEHASGGGDVLIGGAGDDTAIFAHDFNDYTVMDFGGHILVKGPEGTDTLTSIEHLKFADATITPVDDGDPLFDSLYYLSRNSDVFHAGVDAREHFDTFGWHQGRDPNPFFDVSGYLAVNPDVAGMNPLEHYHQSGWKQGRDPSADFDTTLYLIHNPDVAAAGVDPLAHYLAFGANEGRQAWQAVGAITAGFDAQYYLLHNPDVAAAGVDARAHFDSFGWHEGRNPNGWFDTRVTCRTTPTWRRRASIRSSTTCSSAGRRAATPPRVSTRSATWRPIRRRGGRRQPARAFSPSASMRAARPSMTAVALSLRCDV